MAITAHIIDSGKFTHSVSFADHDPSETELIFALGGIESDMAAITMGAVGKVEVNFVASQPKRRMVIGIAPKISHHPKERPDVTLTATQAENLVASVETLWKQFG